MALTPDDISEEYIASSRALAVTGTHLSHANTRAAVLKALEYARRHGLRTALDIDYRPVLWGSPRSAMAKPVSLSPDRSPASCRKCCICSIWWWEPKKSFILPGQHRYPDRAEKCAQCHQSHSRLQARADGLRGAGRRHPGQLGPVPLQQGVRVEVLNVLGAGDAFMSGLLRGWLNDEGWEQACRYANACGALVVSATAARRRCRPKSNSMTTCSAPNRCRARTSTSASTTCTGSPAAVSSGRSCAFSPLTIVNSWPIWRGRPGATKPAFRSSSCCCWPRRSGGAGGRSRSAQRHSGRRHLRPACAQRHYRQGLVDRPPYRTAQLATTASGAWQHRLAADRLAAGACRQMPGLLSPGRPGGAACRAGRPAARGLAGL